MSEPVQSTVVNMAVGVTQAFEMVKHGIKLQSNSSYLCSSSQTLMTLDQGSWREDRRKKVVTRISWERWWPETEILSICDSLCTAATLFCMW